MHTDQSNQFYNFIAQYINSHLTNLIGSFVAISQTVLRTVLFHWKYSLEIMCVMPLTILVSSVQVCN